MKKFTGVSFTPLKVNLNRWDGWGITLCNLSVHHLGKLVSFTKCYSLFYINLRMFYEYGGQELRLMAGVMGNRFEVWKKVIKEQEGPYCDWCGERKKSTKKRDNGDYECDDCYRESFKEAP